MRLFIVLWVFLLCSVGNAQEETPEVRVIQHNSMPTAIALSPDDQTLAIWQIAELSGDAQAGAGTITLININTGDEIGVLEGASDYAMGAAFSSDGSALYSVHGNGDIHHWNVADGTLINRIETLLTGTNGAELLSDDRTLVVKFDRYFLHVDTETGAITRILGERYDSRDEVNEMRGSTTTNFDLMYAGYTVDTENNQLISATLSGDVLLWNADEPAQPDILYAAPDERSYITSITKLDFTADGQSVVYYHRVLNALIRYDVETRQESGRIESGSMAFAVSPDGERVAWLNRSSTPVIAAAFDNPDVLLRLVELTDPADIIITPYPQLAFTSDGNRLVVSGIGYDDLRSSEIYVIGLN